MRADGPLRVLSAEPACVRGPVCPALNKPVAPAGVELGGALKNVLAIACGINDGLGFGCNGRAALITRGLSEMTRLAVALGAHPLTMGGLAGMGDLVLTCTGAARAIWRSHAQV